MNVNYVFDCNTDFYAELNKIINEETDEKKVEADVNEIKCLISMAVCTNKTDYLAVDLLKKIGIYDYFEYVAGHNTFDYCKPDPRHLTSIIEILDGDINKSIMNSGCDRTLSIGQIKCPLCRNVQNGLIPYIPEVYDMKINGVNYPLKYCMFTHNCKYVYKYGAKKGQACNKKCNDIYCSMHMNRKHNKVEQQKCRAILKTGINKGKECGCIAKLDNLCGKHKK